MPPARAASTARFDGALDRDDGGEPGGPRLLHDLEAGPAADPQAEIGAPAAVPSSSKRPTTLSTALCRPMSSRTTTASPVRSKAAAACTAAGGVEQPLRGAHPLAARRPARRGRSEHGVSSGCSDRRRSAMDVEPHSPHDDVVVVRRGLGHGRAAAASRR